MDKNFTFPHMQQCSRHLFYSFTSCSLSSLSTASLRASESWMKHPRKSLPPGIGKGTILGFRMARLLGCLGLLVLSIFPSSHGHGDARREGLIRPKVILLSTPYLYASVLAFLSVSPKNTRHRLIRHANCVLFLAFCVYVYRDLVPLTTFTGVPADVGEGWRIWAKIGLLFIAAVIIPLFTPRQYIPVDPLNPQTALNPEQTASIFSVAFYFFLDPIIFHAYRESQLQEDELYPLPLAINKLLQYIEMRDQGADVVNVVRPWVWIGLIFLGPIVRSLSWQIYYFINTRSFARAEAIITQLVFSHRQAEAKDAEASVPAVEGPRSASRAASDGDSTATVAADNEEGPSRSEAASPTVQASSSSIKSTSEQAPRSAKKEARKPETKKSEGNLVGKINNLVTTDMGNIGSREFLNLLIGVPLQIVIGIWFLYILLGWSVWVGVASIVLLLPVPGYMAKIVQSVQKERMKRADERVQYVSEAVNVLRMIKLFGWEGKTRVRIGDKREEELAWIRKKRMIDLASGTVNFFIPMITMTLTYATYHSINQITFWLNNFMTWKVSLDRLDDFMKNTELLDSFDEKQAPVLLAAASSTDERIGFRNATFSWSKESDGSSTRSQCQFQLKIEGEVLFERGRINLVVGPTGSAGKTSLLMALLGEMHFIPSSPDSWFNLPRSSGVAYAAQESWVLNETIRSNIVFDTPFYEERYQKVLYQCALEPDLDLFHAGDQTEVGEKGLTLSGGQKARLTLARAVYSKASILLLDDVLAALDGKMSWGEISLACGCVNQNSPSLTIQAENRTVILVTHNVALARPIADFVVTFGSDGRIQSPGTMSEIAKRGPLAAQIQKDQQILDKTEQEIDAEDPVAKPVDGKLIVAEEVQLGHVDASAWKMYFFAMGGNYPLFFFVFFFGSVFVQHGLVALRTWQLGYWARQYDLRPAEEVDVVFYLSIFVGIAFASVVVSSTAFIYLVFRQLRAMKVIHRDLIASVLSAPFRWLDVTPTSRIIARVTNDMRAVDDSIASQCWPLATIFVSMIVKFAAVVIYTPIFFFPGLFVGGLGVWVGQVFISGQLPARRLWSNTQAPVLAHFGTAIAGLVSIRAFGAESKFGIESQVRIDRYTRVARNYYNFDRWVSVRIDSLGAIFSAALATYLVYIKHTSAGDSGFLLNMAITFTSLLLWVVRLTNDLQLEGNSLERIQGYIHIEHEKPATETGKPPAYWPASGDLRVEGLSAGYSEDGPKVLHDISFHIKSGERVGIVGRTGSGKSSLTLSLLRCIPTEGSVKYDGLETSDLNLDALRSSITIIPQVPELLSGSLRANLDPFGQYDDVELNSALRAAGLFALQNETDEGRITLDSAISTGGTNLSAGQRQILALARAIVRRSKILILDEATSAIDYKTDAIIQNSLRQELSGDVSLITVAHRLQTIMDADKIMVLDAGRIVEFDSPKALLKVKDGKLRALVEESGDREVLYAMAGADRH
ncbi:Multidrug resistance-associated ABC transporter protein [Mycena venus]|uniref:Multidrug resistance-associated ABC transporter protein n=1 Tax=Mycena venus TaxID=2733690 RepID=A0A8H7D9V5_9AGAR|nr:Multidrug resistance-associated ABC transporter protein [Mycena venus]